MGRRQVADGPAGHAPATASRSEGIPADRDEAAPGAPAPLVGRHASAPYGPAAPQPAAGLAPAPGQNGGGPRPAAPPHRPTPVVVARAVSGGTRPAAPALRPAVRLLAARPLAVSTGAASDMAPTAPAVQERPVVAARWAHGPELPGAGGPVAVAPAPAGAAPRVQRASAPPPPRAVRPAPTSGGSPAATPRRALPVTQPPGHLPTVQPSFTPAAATRGEPVAPVARPARRAVQRDTGAAGDAATGTDPAATQSTATGTATTTVSTGTQTPPAPQGATGADLDDLARRLIDPVSRLLRSDLRRGRERTGRPGDRRR
ncbi:hypothetical protein AB0910_11055 [Streptomyces sp. NPDC047002]|uniref:hypothetical protein n=1 Tax=Streptomyces sp. NPDC047002 TaxID=3155475 RepID=UPI0034537CFC